LIFWWKIDLSESHNELIGLHYEEFNYPLEKSWREISLQSELMDLSFISQKARQEIKSLALDSGELRPADSLIFVALKWSIKS